MMDATTIRQRYAARGWQGLRVAAIDLETTGLSCWADEVIEVAVWTADVSLGLTPAGDPRLLVEPGASYVALCGAREVPPRITDLTGISPWLVRDLPGFAETWDARCTPLLVGVDLLVAHNADFEAGFLSAQTCGTWPAWWLDTRILAAAIDGADRFAKGYRLGDVAARYGLPWRGPAHRASPDAQMCLQVLEVLINEGLWQGPADALLAQRAWLDR